jgi:hypothetical protein
MEDGGARNEGARREGGKRRESKLGACEVHGGGGTRMEEEDGRRERGARRCEEGAKREGRKIRKAIRTVIDPISLISWRFGGI